MNETIVIAKVRELRKKIAQLPPAEQRTWMRRLKRTQDAARMLAVAGAADVDLENADGTDWLPFANWLDDAYTAVSDRVVELTKKGEAVARDTGKLVKDAADGSSDSLSKFGFAALAPGLLVLGGLYLWSQRNGK